MKLIVSFSFSLLSVFTSFSQKGEVIDKIVAQVGDNVVLLSDVQAQKLQAIQGGVEITPEIDCQILEQLMYQYLLLNQAQLDSIIVTDAQVDAEMENKLRVIEQQIGGRQKLEEFYGKTVNQIKREFRPIIKNQLLSKEMERQMTSEITVTPRDVENFFNSLPMDSIPLINSQLSFQQIVYYPQVTVDDKKRAYDQLNDIRNAIIRDGKSFSTQARIHSMDPGSATKGGKMEATRGMMVPAFEATVFNTQIGDVSDVFETTYGYHILKLLDRKGDNYTVQHILIIPNFENDAIEQAAYKLDSCYQLLKAGKITWEEAVKKYSNDEATMQNGGIITNPITGEQTWDMEDLNRVDQQIYLLTDAMEQGDISEPNLYTNLMERKQGVRIVRLLKRTSPHRANLKDDYTLIQRATENNKRMKHIETWTQQKISNAYIKIDDDYKNCEFQNDWIAK
ncbi:MAG: peptidylprolyl isomerase [Fluviicola sp.]|nr:peptidylprolyl isomerase [Fluviicola sp.]